MTRSSHPSPHQEDRHDAPRRGWAHQAHRSVHPALGGADGDVVEWIASGLATVSPAWQLTEGQSPTAHHAERLLATDAYDAWLVYWPPLSKGLWTPDVQAPGVVAVVDGVLRITSTTPAGVRPRNLLPGDTVRVGDTREWMANPTPDAVTTLHVYSPPIGSLERAGSFEAAAFEDSAA
jgi:hypothetical protein